MEGLYYPISPDRRGETGMNCSGLVCLVTGFVVLGAATVCSQPAFPGAEGFGANTAGGRGGTVIEVTSLEDSGPGTLREACEASGARTVVFRTGGTIELRSAIVISHPNLTIAGQTAPGGGICMKVDQGSPYGGALMQVGADEVIIRFLRFRRGPGVMDECCGDPLVIGNVDAPVSGVIVDHCSFSWSTDELLNTWYEVSNVTVQNCILSEGLSNSTHGEEHSKGPFFGDGSTNISLYRNYMVHNFDRNGYFTFDRSGQTAVVECVNNVTYNWVYFGNDYQSRNGGVLHANVIGNRMVQGPDTRLTRYEIGVGENGSPQYSTQIHVSGNLGPHRPALSDPEWDIVGSGVNYASPAPTAYRAMTPFDTPLAGSSLSAQDAHDYVIDSGRRRMQNWMRSGAFVGNRDQTDARVINDMVGRWAVRHRTRRDTMDR